MATEGTGKPTKTVYFIRHAESEENRRLGSMKTAWGDIANLTMPQSSDVSAAFEWLNLPAQLDSDVSTVGRQQILKMNKILDKDNFLSSIELVAHSPLVRAKETSKGVLGCEAPDSVPPPVKRVVELALLEEKSPMEWTINRIGFDQRMRALETWLTEQPETNIVLVGHSQFFKCLLNLDFKFGNCDVWEAKFNGSATEKEGESPAKWSQLKSLHLLPKQADAPGTRGEAEG